MKKLLIVISSFLMLSGCVHKQPKLESFIFPSIGDVATQSVGENLFIQGLGQLEPALTIQEDAPIGSVILRKGEYPFVSKNSSRMKFSRDAQNIYLYYNKVSDKICLDIGKFNEQCAEVKFSITNVLAKKYADSFQQRLIYNGKIGNKITLGYREFNAGMARAAFSNEVAYDLLESSTLGYKGARIEIIKATNTEITYKVLSGFN